MQHQNKGTDIGMNFLLLLKEKKRILFPFSDILQTSIPTSSFWWQSISPLPALWYMHIGLRNRSWGWLWIAMREGLRGIIWWKGWWDCADRGSLRDSMINTLFSLDCFSLLKIAKFSPKSFYPVSAWEFYSLCLLLLFLSYLSGDAWRGLKQHPNCPLLMPSLPRTNMQEHNVSSLWHL